jgi:hypothetical protein
MLRQFLHIRGGCHLIETAKDTLFCILISSRYHGMESSAQRHSGMIHGYRLSLLMQGI